MSALSEFITPTLFLHMHLLGLPEKKKTGMLRLREGSDSGVRQPSVEHFNFSPLEDDQVVY